MRFGAKYGQEVLWFAWRPVRLPSGQWAWLENVYRKKHYRPMFGDYEYTHHPTREAER